MPADSTTPRRPDIPALTSLRFFAALWVAIFHIRELGLWTGGFAWYGAIAQVGYMGVSFFFVLSGFILVYVYSGREIPKLRFWQARFARIYPAYLFSLIVTLPMTLRALPMMKQLHITALVFTTYPLLLEAWFPRILYFWNAVAWSLSVEVIFYLVFPFVIPSLDKLSRNRLLFWIGTCWVASLAITNAYVMLRPDGAAHTTSADAQLFWLNIIKFNPFARLPEFLLGMGFGALFLRSKPTAPLSPILAGTAFLVLAIALRAEIPYPIMHTGLLALGFGLVIFGFATQTPAGILASRPLVVLGEGSYSFYLLHVFPLVIMAFVLHLGNSPHIRAILVGYLLCLILVSVGVHLGIERPMRNLLRPRKRLLPPKTQASPLPNTA